MTNEEHDNSEALYLVGNLCGIASRLNVEALEKFLETPPQDFRYAKESLAALTFAKTLRGDL